MAEPSEPADPRLAQRVHAIPPSGIRRFFDLLASMDDVISLGVGEPDFVTERLSPPKGNPTTTMDS